MCQRINYVIKSILFNLIEVNLTTGNIFQWNLDRNSYIFIHENAFGNVVWKMTAILSRPEYVLRDCYETMIHAMHVAGTSNALYMSSFGDKQGPIQQNTVME